MDGGSINPFDLLPQPTVQVEEVIAQQYLGLNDESLEGVMKISERCYYDQFLSALASESRLAILERLAGREMTVTELTEETGLSQSAVSHHLAALRLAKLVKVRREGRWIFYVADTDCLAVCCRRLFEQLNVRKKVSG